MVLAAAAILIGLMLLVWSADRFVDGASSLAFNLGVSPLVIGLTVVGFGTSAPEMMVSGFAAFEGNPSLGVGNALGSNIANVALILGATALLVPLTVHSQLVKREFPILVAATVLVLLLLLDGYLSRVDGVIMLSVLFAIVAWLVYDALGRRGDSAQITEGSESEVETGLTMKQALFWFVAGLLVLLASARLLVWGAVEVATAFAVSELVIGLTVVAVGTSLPELAASFSAARKGETDLVLGNVIGSNLFNTLAVMALPGLISPSVVPEAVLGRDYPLMMMLTAFLVVLALRPGKSGRAVIGRVTGGVLLFVFIMYQIFLFIGSTA